MFFAGIDLGTSAVKILAMDEAGEVKHIVSRSYSLHLPRPGWSEQDPSDWYEKTCDALRELTQVIDPASIGGVSFSGQMHGLVSLDADDSVIRPAILWNDGRSEKETNYLNDVIGRDNLISYTSNIAFPGFTAPKLLWMREHEPDLFGRIAKIMLPKDYLIYRFTGIHATDYSDAAGSLLLDVPRKEWSPDMLNICQITRDVLPKLYDSAAVVGDLTPQAARDTGLAEGTPVIAGAADNAAAAIGTGTVGPDRCNLSLGTSGTIFLSGDSFTARADTPVHLFVHADGGFHLLGCILSAASCNQWWCEDILSTADYGGETDRIGPAGECDDALGSNSVFFLPYLMGERCPYNDPNVRGAFLGLSRGTTRAQMNQAVLEGVSFGMRDCLEAARNLGADPKSATICGGGAKSALWRRIMANVLNLPLQTVRSEEGPGYGAAILAAVGAGCFGSVRDAVTRLVSCGEPISPDPALSARYETQYQKYRKLYPLLRQL